MTCLGRFHRVINGKFNLKLVSLVRVERPRSSGHIDYPSFKITPTENKSIKCSNRERDQGFILFLLLKIVGNFVPKSSGRI